MPDNGDFTILVDDSVAGKRLDAVVSYGLTACSRSFCANLIRKGHIRVHGEIKKPGYRVRVGDLVKGHIPAPDTSMFRPYRTELRAT